MIFATGLEADFYGVDNDCFKLGDTVFRAVEDEEDGYRSSLKEVQVVANPEGLIFFQTPIARVRIEDLSSHNSYSFRGDGLRDVEDGHLWLAIGTSDYDDYYPMYTFDYAPKAPEGK